MHSLRWVGREWGESWLKDRSSTLGEGDYCRGEKARDQRVKESWSSDVAGACRVLKSGGEETQER